MDKEQVFQQIHRGLIVSCQALETEPLYRPEGGIMPLMAKAAAWSGAVGIRANTVRDIRQIRQAVDLPVIGIIKREYPGVRPYITVTMREVDDLVKCGVAVLAFDGTETPRPDGKMPGDFIREIKARYPEQMLMADIARVEEGVACSQAGVDFVGTTLCGYTPETERLPRPNLELIRNLARSVDCKVIAEGHIHTPEQAVQCIEAGAWAVVVGGAITRPAEITARFTGALSTAYPV